MRAKVHNPTDMEDKEKEYYQKFELALQQDLMNLCGMTGGLLNCDDLEDKWNEIAPEYMADAIPQVNDYPEAAIAWAGYAGMAFAKWWDTNWSTHRGKGYKDLLGTRGFDDMDEHITRDILGHPLESDRAKGISSTLLACARLAVGKIRRENIEAQSTRAFHILSRAFRALYRIGASMELETLGYKYQKLNMSELARNCKLTS